MNLLRSEWTQGSNSERSPELFRARNARVGQGLCLAGAAIGALGLLGEWLELESLTRIFLGLPRMTPNSALALLLAGGAGALRHREPAGRLRTTLALLATLLVLVIGSGTLVEHALSVDLQLDGFLLRNPVGLHPGRPPPPTALALTFLATSLLLFDVRARARARPSEWAAGAAALTALTALLGIVFGAVPLYRLAGAPTMGVSLPTALGLGLVSLGLLLERPAAGVMRVVTSSGPAGELLRRLVPPAIVFPALLGLAVRRLVGAEGAGDVAVVLALLCASMTLVGLFALVVAAVPLNRTHEALEASRARTESLVEQAPDGLFVADLAGRYTDVNDAGCRMLGYSREELVGKTVLELLPTEDWPLLAKSKSRLLEGDVEVGEWRLRRKDGTLLPVEVSARILPDGRWQGLVRDISERKRLESTLQRSYADLNRAQTVGAIGSWRLDVRRNVLAWSDEAYHIFGIPLGKPMTYDAFLACVHPEDRTRVDQAWSAALRSEPYDLQHRILVQGTVKWVREKAELEFDEHGALLGGVGIVQDITVQKRIENDQRFLAEAGAVLASTLDYAETAKNLARLVVGQLADVCFVETVEEPGKVQRLIVTHRDPSRASVARRLQEVQLDRRRPFIGSTVFEDRRPVLMTHVAPDYVDSLAQSESHRELLRELDPRSLIAMPLVAHGRLVGSLVLIRCGDSPPFTEDELELVERVASRAALAVENARLYRLAQRALQEREDVLGVVAHDLRNPLSAILLQAGKLRRRASNPEQVAEGIERTVSRMHHLIQDLLDVSLVEGGRLAVERSRVSAQQATLNAVQAEQPLVAEAALELRLELPKELPEVWADPERLLQVFENLIGNAIKFTGPGGQLTVGAEPRGGEVLFWVADSGAGISPEDLPHVFERFWQARKTGRRGAGLGLTIAKGIVEAQGGHIWATSTLGRGTTFFFTVPTAPSIELRSQRWQPEPPPQPH